MKTQRANACIYPLEASGTVGKQVPVKFDTSRLTRTIRRADASIVGGGAKIVTNAATFFTQTAIKSMPPKGRRNRRKVYTYTEGARSRYAVWTKRGIIFWFRRRFEASRKAPMRYRFLAKWTMHAAASKAGITVAAPPRSEGAPQKGRELGLGRRIGFRIGRPRIVFDYRARDIASPVGRMALNNAQHRASGRLRGWINAELRKQRKVFQRGKR